MDGNRDGEFCHTDSEPNPWWQVDLQGNFTLSEIVVYNRVGYEARSNTITASLSSALWGDSFWSPSYFLSTTGNVSIDVLKKYVENQRAEQE